MTSVMLCSDGLEAHEREHRKIDMRCTLAGRLAERIEQSASILEESHSVDVRGLRVVYIN